jgi:hypothetical protein
MSTTVDIDAQVSLLLERLDNTETDAQLLAGLCAQAPLVRQIATACIQTPAYVGSAAQVAAFQVELEADHTEDERLLAAWLHFLDRIISAPTRLHMIGAVRLCLPLVAQYLPEVGHGDHR